MADVIIDTPSSAPMVEVHIWISHYADGTEGIIATDFPLAGMVTRHIPLMHSVRATAEAFADIARKAQSASQHTGARIVRLELRTFRAVTS
jgi:hypothetical protein